MDLAGRDLVLVSKRLLAATLLLFLLVAFWSERPVSAESRMQTTVDSATPAARTDKANATAPPTAAPPGLGVLRGLRRGWLTLYAVAGAPALDQGKLGPAERSQFVVAVSRLAAFFFAASLLLCWLGRRAQRRARRA